MEKWSKTQVSYELQKAKVNITARTVHFYTDEGIVIPDISNPSGRGTKRLYGFKNLVDFILANQLASYGWSLEAIKEVMDVVRDSGIRDWYLRQKEGWYVLVIADPNTPKMKAWVQAVTQPDYDKVAVPMKKYDTVVIIKISKLVSKISHLK